VGNLLRKLFWPAVIAAIVVGIYLYQALRPVEVEVARVERGRIEEYVTEEAETQLHTERLVAAERAGTMRRIRLEVGDHVSAGQTITSIEDRELALTLGQLQDQLREIEAQLDGADVALPKPAEIEAAAEAIRQAEQQLAELSETQKATAAHLSYTESEFRRISRLHEAGTASEAQYEEVKRDYEVARPMADAIARRQEAARAAVDIARLRKKALEESLGDTAHLHRLYEAQRDRVRKMIELIEQEAVVKSPIDGVVLEKHLDSERYVQPGTPLLTVGDMDSIEIRADILSDEVGRVKPGQKVLLVGPAIRQAGAVGTVRQVYPSGFTKISSLGVRQQRVQVLIDFDNSRLGLAPGYELDVKIAVAAADDAVLVPTEAVFATADGSAVFVVAGGRARLRSISTGLKGDDIYQVTDGLQPGETVILRPPSDLKPGQRVRAKNTETPASSGATEE